MEKYDTKIQQWLPLVGLAITTFIFNTTEFIPIGLLVDIASAFGITEAHAGLLVSVYAWFVALMSLPLMILFSKVEFRLLLFCTIIFFILCNILSALSDSFAILMLSRIGVACTHAIFWSIVSPLAIRIAPKGKKATALGMIVTGTSIAMIIGLPLGRIIGLHLGWRMSFICISVVGVSALLLLIVSFPKVQNTQTFSWNRLPELLGNKVLLYLFTFTFLVVVYSYIEPYLTQVAHLKSSQITLSLILFGIAGVIGSILFSRSFEKHPNSFIFAPIIGIACLLLLMHLLAINQSVIITFCVLWGITITLFNLVSQAQVIQFSPQNTTISMALFSSVYNLGIGCGAIIGGIIEANISIQLIGYTGGIIAVIALFFCQRKLAPYICGKLSNN